MYLIIDSLIEMSNTISSSNSITSEKVIVKSYGFDKIHMDKKLYQITDQFNEKKSHV